MSGRAENAVRTMTRMDAVQSPIIPVIGAMIRQAPGTISLGQGVVHYGPPQAAVDAIREALASADGGRLLHGYGDAAGHAPLVEAIARKLKAENGIDVAQGSRIMVTAGANMAFMHAVLSITSIGDEVILPTPFYFNHEMAIEMAGCRVVRVPTDDHYQLRLDAMEAAITDRTRAIVTISPNNPSGAVLTEPSLRAVNALCAERGLFHISDEPYEYFTYGVGHTSPGALPGSAAHTISMFSLSKAYGFAGWRIGYVVYPEVLTSAMVKSQDTILICPPAVSQHAALAAIAAGPAYARGHLTSLAAMRKIIYAALSDAAVPCDVNVAAGAFYFFLRVHARLDAMTISDSSRRRSAMRPERRVSIV